MMYRLRLSSVALSLALVVGTPALAATGAAGTPVPFPEQPAPPQAEALQRQMSTLGRDTQCRTQIEAYRQQARAQATRLDAAVAFAKLASEAAEAAERHIERLTLMQRLDALNTEVQAGFQAMDEAEATLRPSTSQSQ